VAVQIEQTQAAMHRTNPDALVTGHVALIPGLSLPDPNDQPVLAPTQASGQTARAASSAVVKRCTKLSMKCNP